MRCHANVSEKGLVGGVLLYIGYKHIKTKEYKHKRQRIQIPQTPKVLYGRTVEQDRRVLEQKLFEGDHDDHNNGVKLQ